MSDPSSTDIPPTASDDRPGPYVVEHYGFAAVTSAGAGDPIPLARIAPGPRGKPARVPRPRGDGRRRRLLAAGVLGVVLAGGIGGVAAAADTGPDGHRDGIRVGAPVQLRDGHAADAGPR